MTSKTKWTLAIVGLLAGNVLAMATLAVISARGSSQVIPAYYEQATHYDDRIDRATASHELGWHATAAFAAGELAIDLRDATGAAIRGAHVSATGYQRSRSSEPFTVELAETDRYRGAVAVRAGVNDIVVTAVRAGAHYEQHLVIEAR